MGNLRRVLRRTQRSFGIENGIPCPFLSRLLLKSTDELTACRDLQAISLLHFPLLDQPEHGQERLWYNIGTSADAARKSACATVDDPHLAKSRPCMRETSRALCSLGCIISFDLSRLSHGSR